MPRQGIAPAPRRIATGPRAPCGRAGAGFRRLSGGRCLAPSGDWASGNPAFAISRGSPGAPSRTPEHGRRFAWHATVPFTFQIPGKAIRSTDTSSSPCPLRGRYGGCATWRSRSNNEQPLEDRLPASGSLTASTAPSNNDVASGTTAIFTPVRRHVKRYRGLTWLLGRSRVGVRGGCLGDHPERACHRSCCSSVTKQTCPWITALPLPLLPIGRAAGTVLQA